jgi:hypothetical protein
VRSPILVVLEGDDVLDGVIGLAEVGLADALGSNEGGSLGGPTLTEVSDSDRIPGIRIPRGAADSAGPPLPRAT